MLLQLQSKEDYFGLDESLKVSWNHRHGWIKTAQPENAAARSDVDVVSGSPTVNFGGSDKPSKRYKQPQLGIYRHRLLPVTGNC